MESSRITKVLSLKDEKFKQLIGVKKNTFIVMTEILLCAYEKDHSRGGKPSRLTVADRLLITLQYHREYRTMEHLAFDFGVVVSRIHSIIVWVENVLAADSRFTLPGKEALLHDKVEIIAVDVTEQRIERPKKIKKSGIRARKNITL